MTCAASDAREASFELYSLEDVADDRTRHGDHALQTSAMPLSRPPDVLACSCGRQREPGKCGYLRSRVWDHRSSVAGASLPDAAPRLLGKTTSMAAVRLCLSCHGAYGSRYRGTVAASLVREPTLSRSRSVPITR